MIRITPNTTRTLNGWTSPGMSAAFPQKDRASPIGIAQRKRTNRVTVRYETLASEFKTSSPLYKGTSAVRTIYR